MKVFLYFGKRHTYMKGFIAMLMKYKISIAFNIHVGTCTVVSLFIARAIASGTTPSTRNPMIIITVEMNLLFIFIRISAVRRATSEALLSFVIVIRCLLIEKQAKAYSDTVIKKTMIV